MIPRLPQQNTVEPLYREFLADLVAGPFAGEVRSDAAARLVAATDNSVYQLAPQAVIFPRSRDDVVVLAHLAAQPKYRRVRMTPRGAGTGTTGASLGTGLAIDMSKYMSRILAFDATAGLVRVQPGVILDQLNDYLRPHGVFFAPHVAPADRATLGGMIGNDSCGKGSRLYGRTSRHIESLEVVLSDGNSWRSAPLPADDRDDAHLPPRIAMARNVVARLVRDNADLIRERFPRHSRFLSGYDLAHAMRPDGAIDLTAVIAGSEGTLAFIVEALLRVTPIPAHKRLVLVSYDTFDSAIAAADYLLAFEPSAIETIDETILGLAKTDMIWPSVVGRLAAPAVATAGAINLVELCDSDLDRLRQRICELINGSSGVGVISAHSIESDEEAHALWALRERGVGLLGNMPGPRRPVPFVEDCAVPPRRLHEFVAAFRAILEEHGLDYGMYGHVDVGCLHVRPALDMTDPADAKILRDVSDRVFRLVQEFGGVFWGEHGKGMRSEYNPEVFGPVLYEGIRQVKQAFDPFNQMNPGKIATPAASEEPLVSIDGPTRGDHDGAVAAGARIAYEGAIACNGNGACLTWAVDRPMCPSMKVTADRVHSPKGRAALMREWLRQLSLRGWDADDRTVPVRGAAWFDPRPWLRQFFSPTDFSHEVYAAFAGCLSCKACVAECPLHVDIPGFKAEFLHAYHQRYPRRLADHLIADMEGGLPRIHAHARTINRLTAWSKGNIPAAIGLVDLPSLAPESAESRLRTAGAEFIAWSGPSPAVRGERCVAVIPDAFTNYFAPSIVTDLYEILRGCGVRVVVLPYRASGKSHHVRGFLHEFRAVATGYARDLANLAQQGVELVCVEPAIALFFRQEYRSVAAAARGFHVELPQEWLAKNLAIRAIGSGRAYQLMSHCTEATTAAAANRLWRAVFERAGLRLEIPPVGCCGMAGAYGHEKEHAADSREIFAQSWQRRIAGNEPALILATGHSCRTQVARIAGFAPKHPIEVLAANIPAPKT